MTVLLELLMLPTSLILYIMSLPGCYLQELLNKAIVASVAARRDWDLKPVQDRAQILFKAADVISGPKRAEILAKTMIGQVQTGPRGGTWSLLVVWASLLVISLTGITPNPELHFHSSLTPGP